MFTIETISKHVSVFATGETAPLDPDSEAEIQSIWDAEEAKPGRTLFNGRIFSVISASAKRIEGCFVEYRQLIAQQAQPTLFATLGVRPLGVSGLVRCTDGLIFGCRGEGLTQDAGQWELVPSGSVDTQFVGPDGRVNLAAQISLELVEEIGVPRNAINDITPCCLIEDNASHVCDIGLTLWLGLSGDEIMAAHRALAGDEYCEIAIVAEADVASHVDGLGGTLIETSRLLLTHHDLLS